MTIGKRDVDAVTTHPRNLADREVNEAVGKNTVDLCPSALRAATGRSQRGSADASSGFAAGERHMQLGAVGGTGHRLPCRAKWRIGERHGTSSVEDERRMVAREQLIARGSCICETSDLRVENLKKLIDCAVQSHVGVRIGFDRPHPPATFDNIRACPLSTKNRFSAFGIGPTRCSASPPRAIAPSAFAAASSP